MNYSRNIEELNENIMFSEILGTCVNYIFFNLIC